MEILLVILVIAVLVAIFAISIYNKLVGMRENVKRAWKAISLALENRLRAIGGLIDTAKNYMDFEKGTLSEITAARGGLRKAIDSGDAKAAFEANEQLQAALPAINVQVEAYPELKAMNLMENVQNAFTETADKITSNQKYYNGSVREYNKQIQVFPNNIFAGLFGFKQAEYYESDKAIQDKVNDADLGRDMKF